MVRLIATASRHGSARGARCAPSLEWQKRMSSTSSWRCSLRSRPITMPRQVVICAPSHTTRPLALYQAWLTQGQDTPTAVTPETDTTC